jgi:hypothetical protein
MRPCMPQQKDSGACPLYNRTSPGYCPGHLPEASFLPAHSHVVSTLALAACRRGVAWSRRCRAYISVGGILETGNRAFARYGRGCSSRGRGETVAPAPAVEVVP